MKDLLNENPKMSEMVDWMKVKQLVFIVYLSSSDNSGH